MNTEPAVVLPWHGRETSERRIADADWERLERHAAEILAAFGMDLDTPGTRETPARFLRALYDATAGYDGDPKLLTSFPAEHAGDAVGARSSKGRSRSTRSASITRFRSTAPHTLRTSSGRRSSASRS